MLYKQHRVGAWIQEEMQTLGISPALHPVLVSSPDIAIHPQFFIVIG